MINLNQLRAFYQAAKHLSFTKAAKELYITQPAVTSQVKLFEDSLDIKLFKKKAGRVRKLGGYLVAGKQRSPEMKFSELGMQL